jgi:hypothetical protein
MVLTSGVPSAAKTVPPNRMIMRALTSGFLISFFMFFSFELHLPSSHFTDFAAKVTNNSSYFMFSGTDITP